MNFAQKILFMLLLKIILWHFDNYMTYCQGENYFGLLHLFIFVVFYLKVLNLDYSKNVPSSCINYCSMNEDVQYESGTSSVQVRICSTSKVDQFWHRVYY